VQTAEVNHGLPVYKKNEQVSGLDIMLYFWDERDGPACSGWWFGPQVGGDQVWGYHPERGSEVPPVAGWKVPCDGPVDPMFRVTVKEGPSPGDKRAAPQDNSRSNRRRTGWDTPTEPQAQQSWQGGGGWGGQEQHQSGKGGGGRRSWHDPQEQAQREAEEKRRAEEEQRKRQEEANRKRFDEFQRRQEEQREFQRRKQEEARQAQEAKDRAEAEARRQKEEMARRQKEEHQRKLQEQRRKIEDMKRKAEEEQQRKREEQQLKMEEQKRKMEKARLEMQEEARRKREQAEKRAMEQKAAIAVRRVIQKVRVATQENLEGLQQEMEAALEQEASNLGSQQQALKEECEKAVQLARKRIEQLEEQRQRAEEKRLEEEKKRKEREELKQALMKELEGLVDAAEEGNAKVLEASKQVDAGNLDESPEKVQETIAAVEAAYAEAKALTKACSDFVVAKSNDLKEPEQLKILKLPGAADDAAETKRRLKALLDRVQEYHKANEASIAKAKGATAAAEKRAAARSKTEGIRAVFDKYDKDRDGALSRKEVVAYAKGEFACEVPAAILDTLLSNNTDAGAAGVAFSNFLAVRLAIGVAREHQRDQKRQQDKAEREGKLTSMKAQLQEKIKEANNAVNNVDKEVAKCEKLVQDLKSKAKTDPVQELLKMTGETEETAESVKTMVAEAKAQISGVSESLTDDFKEDLKGWLSKESKLHDIKLGRMEQRISRVETLCKQVRDDAAKRKATEVDKLRAAVVKVIRYNQMLRKKATSEEMFDELDTKGDGALDEEEFTAFFETAEKVIKDVPLESSTAAEAAAESTKEAEDEGAKASEEAKEEGKEDAKKAEGAKQPPAKEETVELSPEDLKRLFGHLCDEGASTISRDTFAQFVRLYMRVIREAILTSEMAPSSSKVLRKLAAQEVVEVLQGPFREEATGIVRIEARAFKDGERGWVSVLGNKGARFLKEGGHAFKVLKETILTDEFSLEASKEETRKLKQTTTKLKVGELIEVLEWPAKEEQSELMRAKVKSMNGGVVGYVTTMGNTGTAFIGLA